MTWHWRQKNLQFRHYLENSSEDEIHKKMLDNLPEDIDKSEGGFSMGSHQANGN